MEFKGGEGKQVNKGYEYIPVLIAKILRLRNKLVTWWSEMFLKMRVIQLWWPLLLLKGKPGLHQTRQLKPLII